MPSAAQTRLENAILANESAEAEVERLCDIVERAAEALRYARRLKRNTKKELNAAAKAARGNSSPRAIEEPTSTMDSEEEVVEDGEYDEKEYESIEATDEEDADYEDTEGFGDEDDETDEGDEEAEDALGGFDMDDEALEQVRYRLVTAKIDPNSPLGTKLLDELLIQLQDANVEFIDVALVNEFIDRLLFDTEEEGAVVEGGELSPPPQDPEHPELPVIRINRGGKVLGWYIGQLDERGYAREGTGSMYYDAGHTCHGTWQDDEMVGRGMYKWSDGHVYDGDWSNGKRHGLGRFNRPDNVILYGRYVNGHHNGEGVRWSADRIEAQLVVDGVPKKSISLTMAKEIATNLGFADTLPPPVVVGATGDPM